MKEKRKFGFETRMLHAGHIPDSYAGARAVPIFQTSGYVFDSPEQAAQLFELKQYGNIYTRINNPTTAVFEERIASLENGTGGVATASGMAAQFNTMMENWVQAITPKTKALYGETIGNPRGSILDIEALADLAHSHKIPLIVDSTFATPYLCRPLAWGADIVIHSATKFIGGHGTSIGGVVVEAGTFGWANGRFPAVADPSPAYHGLAFHETFGMYGYLQKLRSESLRDLGAALSPFNAFLFLLGIETLPLRRERHVANALGVAEFLARHPMAENVRHPGLPGSPYRPLVDKYLPRGAGAI